ncbi:MAG: cation diffusion facilitator family transporter [Candidatus Levybacteria bacterium]|nr:cation diffusion facilitator family transporter [Candidatus Levybacteria bacterium]
MDKRLDRFVWISIGAAILTITLKGSAYFITGSVGLLSDALESFVNLAAATFALFIIKIAVKPPDEEHMYGHSKAEYFSSVIEGILIIVASVSIIIPTVSRLFNPQALEQPILGLIISAIASIVNLTVATLLLRAGKKYRSITLEADAHHLFTDVWTSVGVIIGVSAVAITGLYILDPVIAIVVGVNIIYTGVKLIKRSIMGFMDVSISAPEQKIIQDILVKYEKKGLKFHGIRTRQSAFRRFVSLHVLAPGSWSIQKGHDWVEKVEIEIRKTIPAITVTTHLEPLEDKKSWNDEGIDK